MLKNSIILLFLFTTLVVKSQEPPPDFRCISIDGSDVTLTWGYNYDSANVEEFHVWRSVDLVTWGKIPDTIPGNAVSFTYTDSAVKDSVIYYFLRLIDINTGYSDTSRILSTILLDVSPLNNGSVASLIWNQPFGAKPDAYQIYRKDQASDWQIIDTVANEYYRDTITYPYCEETKIFYKVGFIESEIGCFYSSISDSASLNDGTPPGNLLDIVEMDTVSVAYDGSVAISWLPENEDDIKEYIINKIIGSNWVNYDTVMAPETFYIDLNSDAQNQIETYRITAVDQCNNTGLGGYDIDPFRTMFLNPISFDFCDTSIELKWNNYINFNNLEKYSVFQLNTSDFTTSLIDETTDTVYIHTAPFIPDSTYCYFIRAYEDEPGNRSASSCVQCFYANRPDQPDTLNLILGTVDTLTNQTVNLLFLVDTSAKGNSYVLLRKDFSSADYDTLIIEPVRSTTIITYTDTEADPGVSGYYYKLLILDSCMNECWLPRNEIRTILLAGQMTGQNINSLEWNPYETTTGDVIEYRLYRKNNGIIDTVITLPPYETMFDDDVSAYYQAGGRFSYVVAALVKSGTNTQNDTIRSYSNEIRVTQITNINMPNAFTPNNDGINDLFRPVNYFPDVTADYLLIVYNRWGQKIFESSDPGEGWDGTFRNVMSPQGVYIYYVRYFSGESLNFEKKGTVTLIR